MASRPRRARVALGVIALAVIGLGVWAWEPLYWWVILKRFRSVPAPNDARGSNIRSGAGSL